MPIKKVRLEPELLRGTHIFPANIIRQPSTTRAGWIGFHGTTTTYEDRIEKEGARANPVLTEEEVSILCEVGWGLMGTAREPKTFEKLLKEAAGFAKRKVVNFFSVSLLAPEHTKTRGGQGKQRVMKPLVDDVLNNRQFEHADPRRRIVENMRQKLEAEPAGSSVVFAVSLRGIERIWYLEMHSAIQADGPIERWRIIARLDAPDFEDYAQATEQSGKIESTRLACALGSQHFTAHLPPEPPLIRRNADWTEAVKGAW